MPSEGATTAVSVSLFQRPVKTAQPSQSQLKLKDSLVATSAVGLAVEKLARTPSMTKVRREYLN